MHRDEAIYARSDARAGTFTFTAGALAQILAGSTLVTISREDAQLAADAVTHSADVVEAVADLADPKVREVVPRLRALAARLTAASTTSSS